MTSNKTMNTTHSSSHASYSSVVNTFKHPTKEQAIILSSIEGTKVHDYIIAVGSLVGPQQINFRDLQLRLDRIEKLFDDFDNAQSLIEASDEDYTSNADTIHGIERSSFETSFFHITSAVLDFIDTNLSKPRDQAAQASNSTISSENSSQTSINIRDTFNSIIHTSTELSNIQKFRYLRLSLQGIAAETIRNLDISEATYETAWELLQVRFENKCLLVNNHIKKLFNLPNVSKNSHHDLRTLLDGFQRHLRSLKSLELDTTSWDALIIYLITTKLDNATHKEWELSIKDDKITLPSLSNLTEFLEGKCRVLESVNHQEEKSRPKFPSTGNSQKLIETRNQTSSSLPCSSPVISESSNALTARNISFEHKSTTLRSTVKIKVFDISGNEYEARALLDNGSESNFISQRLLNLLRLPTTKTHFSISGINQTNYFVSYRTSVKFKSKTLNFSQVISCLVLPEIAGNLPSITFDKKTLNIPSNITLADPDFNISSPIDLLIGADIFWNLICIGQIKLSPGQPILQKTKLGWIISGPLFPNNSVAVRTTCHLSTINNLSIEDQLQKFWEIKECPKTKFLSNEELSCKDHFLKTTSLNSSGRFVVSLPLKSSGDNLGNSKTTATKRFYSLEKKLNANFELKDDYTRFIDEYLSLHHMSVLPFVTIGSEFFLPHHCVYKGNKIRVVFDGSANTDSGVSLNDILMIGPNLQDDLFTIISRFRKHSFVLTADI
ncbi:uncharacterized protein [Diabrotica undecimpunctata]|uniref:uncharacterized protein n=1 Tax=Diabrotica undecimpunctata TaxID=50387 RepID=UPI003B632368